MAELMSYHPLALSCFLLATINGIASVWKSFNRKILRAINIFSYICILVSIFQGNKSIEWFGQLPYLPETSFFISFAVISAITGIFFLKVNSKEDINGSLFVTILLILNLGVIFSSDILRISLLFIIFEILELLVLSNTNNPKKSMLRDIALIKLLSIILLSIATTFITISTESTSLLEINVKNYDFYHLGICFFVVYTFTVMYVVPLEDIRKNGLFHSSNFAIICSIVSKFVIIGTIVILLLKKFILAMAPFAQEEILGGIKILLFISMALLALKAIGKNCRDVSYYLFCANNILALFFIYAITDVDIKVIFFLLAASSLGFFIGIYIEKEKAHFQSKQLKILFFILYFIGIMGLWGAPTTAVFKVRIFLIEQISSLETMSLLIFFIFVLGPLWYPMIVSLKARLQSHDNLTTQNKIGTLEKIGLFLVFLQIIFLNYSNMLPDLFNE